MSLLLAILHGPLTKWIGFFDFKELLVKFSKKSFSNKIENSFYKTSNARMSTHWSLEN